MILHTTLHHPDGLCPVNQSWRGQQLPDIFTSSQDDQIPQGVQASHRKIQRSLRPKYLAIDYIDLNQHCPKDPFPLPRIDQVVDSTAGSVLLCFLDCYFGYHQIALNPDDEDKTTFITPNGIYCYKVMTFGLKNVGATY
jgi:hypothetical protein